MTISIFAELKRRNVIKIASVYLITSWLVLQIVSVLSPYLKLPSQLGTIVTVVLIIGFPFACIIAWAFELTPDGVKLSKDVEHSESIAHETGSKINVLLVVSLILALMYISYDKLFTVEIDESKALSIAVLPFADMSADKSQEYFSDGIAEEILNSLARLKPLQVIARTSSFQFKNKQQDIRSIADTLGVNYVLEGSVRKDNNKLRVTAQLIEADSGRHLWSQTYDRQLSDIFSLQDELTFAITEALKLNLLPNQVKVEQGMTENQDAYDSFLKGRSLGYQRNAQALLQATEYLKRAVELDPDFALARAQLYVVYELAMYYGDMEQAKGLLLQTDLFHELLTTEQVFPLKFVVFANHIESTENKPELVKTLYQKAIKLAPSDAIIQNWRLLSLINIDGVEAVIDAREALFKINPLDLINISNLAKNHFWLGNQTEYHFYVDKLRKDSPDHSLTAAAVVEKLFNVEKQPQQALDYLTSFNGEMNTETKMMFIELLLVTGNFEKALNVLAGYLGENARHHEIYSISIANLLSYSIAASHSNMGLANVRKRLNLNDDEYQYYARVVRAMQGDESAFVEYMQHQFADAEAFIAAEKELPLMSLYALIQSNRGDKRYLERYPLFQNSTELCVETQGRYSALCPIILANSGVTRMDRLLLIASESLKLHDMGSDRYMLTSPFFSIVHNHPEFIAKAEKYLNSTYRKWENQNFTAQ